MTRASGDLASALCDLTVDREALASAVRRAQANYLAAWEKHRLAGDDETRRDFESAKDELDEVREHVEVAEVTAKR